MQAPLKAYGCQENARTCLRILLACFDAALTANVLSSFCDEFQSRASAPPCQVVQTLNIPGDVHATHDGKYFVILDNDQHKLHMFEVSCTSAREAVILIFPSDAPMLL